MGDNKEAKKYYERALSIELNNLGPDHVDVARTYLNMGNLHHDLGEHQQAKEYYERALSIQLNTFGPDHVDVARRYHNIGNLHHNLGEHQQAKEYYERALSIQLNKLGPDHVDVARTYRSLADVQGVLDAQQLLANRNNDCVQLIQPKNQRLSIFVTLFSYHNLRRWLIFSDFASKIVRAISSHL